MVKYTSEFPLLLRLNNILLYVCTTFCLSCHPPMDTWIASHLLAFVNNAAISIHTQVSEWTNVSFLLGIFLGVELLGYMVNSVLTFRGIATFFSTVLYHFTFPLAMYISPNFSISSPTFIIGHLSDYSHSCIVNWNLIVVSMCISLITIDIEPYTVIFKSSSWRKK